MCDCVFSGSLSSTFKFLVAFVLVCKSRHKYVIFVGSLLSMGKKSLKEQPLARWPANGFSLLPKGGNQQKMKNPSIFFHLDTDRSILRLDTYQSGSWSRSLFNILYNLFYLIFLNASRHSCLDSYIWPTALSLIFRHRLCRQTRLWTNRISHETIRRDCHHLKTRKSAECLNLTATFDAPKNSIHNYKYNSCITYPATFHSLNIIVAPPPPSAGQE